MSSVIRSLVREILMEDQAYKRLTGKKYTADVEMFRDAVGKPDYYIHLSDIPKLGVNPQTGYLPGLYLYPNTKANYEAVILGSGQGSVVASRAARYVFLVKLRNDLNLLRMDSLNDHLNETFDSIVKPILDDALDIRTMAVGTNAKDYFNSDGTFKKQWSQSSVVPVLRVSPEDLETAGDETLPRAVEKIVELIDEVLDLIPLKGKARAPVAVELNKKIRRVLQESGISSVMRDGVPFIDSPHRYGKEEVAGVKVTSTGTVTSTAITTARNTLVILVNQFVDFDDADGRVTFNPEKLSYLKAVQRGSTLGSRNYELSALFKGIASRLKSTAKFYYYIMRAGGPDTRASAISELLRSSEAPNPRFAEYESGVGELVGKDGEPVSRRELATKILDALMAAMSRPGKQITREYLMKKKGTEELNILLALGGGEFDGIVDSGQKFSGGGRLYGALGIEGQQTFILPPIDSKLEGGGPVVMIDRMVGLSADATPRGSVQGTSIENYEESSPREIAISSRQRVPDEEAKAAYRAGKSISRTRERLSTSLDYPPEGI